MSASERASLPGGENLGSGQNISQGCCPSRLGNGATGFKKQVPGRQERVEKGGPAY